MTADLASIFATLQRHHIATEAAPLPEAAPGVVWVWAANGIFKRGVTADLDVLIRVHHWATPGLARLAPHIRWRCWPGRLPGYLLGPLLEDARRAASDDLIARPIERQYFIAWRDGRVKVVMPREQDATATRVRYTMPDAGPILLDIHSHNSMRAFFSGTDNRDDAGLSVSAVVGHIFERPEIAVRANVYGHHMALPALAVFDALPDGLRDTYRGAMTRSRSIDHANADY